MSHSLVYETQKVHTYMFCVVLQLAVGTMKQHLGGALWTLGLSSATGGVIKRGGRQEASWIFVGPLLATPSVACSSLLFVTLAPLEAWYASEH